MNGLQYAYQSDFNNASDSIRQVSLILGCIVIICLIIGLTSYILQSIGLMKLAKRNNIKYSWLAFIPVANTYIYGKVAFEDKIKTFILLGIKIISTIILSSYYSNLVLSYVNSNTAYTSDNTITNVFSWIYVIFLFYASYQIFKKYSDKAVIMLVFSVLSCGFLTPIFLFAIRNNERKN